MYCNIVLDSIFTTPRTSAIAIHGGHPKTRAQSYDTHKSKQGSGVHKPHQYPSDFARKRPVSVNELGLRRVSFQVHVDKARSSVDPSNEQKYTEYVIAIQTGQRKWKVARRYREFRQLHSHLQKDMEDLGINLKLPNLPSKKFFGSSLDPEFVEDRRKALQGYLDQLITQVLMFTVLFFLTILVFAAFFFLLKLFLLYWYVYLNSLLL